MNKFLEFGRRALFVIRVISGYEERRIRAHRLQLLKNIEQAQARKEALRKIPEQAILAEVRRMVEEMQAVQRKFEETEAAIEEYFKPFDKNADIIMNMQLEKEEKSAKDLVRAMQQHAILQKAEQERVTTVGTATVSQELTANPTSKETASDAINQEQRP
uniref:Cortactin-binding protein 2 n=1 Tax=Anthurium amnicola TaxID=1678845 RepID=A0A1D1Z734_9ARAE